MKRACIVSLIVIAIAAVAYLAFSFNSLRIAVKSADYDPNDIAVLERGFNDNGKEFRIIKTRKGDNLALVYMEKNNMGFWTVSYTGGNTSPGAHLEYSITKVMDTALLFYHKGYTGLNSIK
jgi:hypothetical protein